MNLKTDSFSEFQTIHLKHFEEVLKSYLTAESTSSQLDNAIRYSTLNGGKRIRPLLIYATGLDLQAPLTSLDPAAVAIELIHCYSLIHDDLPAMDDDDLRRGKATCHIAFNEATAILAGDALQSLSFQVLSSPSKNLTPATQLAMVNALTKAAGTMGMAAGQMLDLEAENQNISLEQLEQIHRLKTAVLISCGLKLAGLAANCSATILNNLAEIGTHLGLAFQIQDDILDVTVSTENLGKKSGADVALNKSTYPKLMGLEKAQLKFQEEYQKAQDLIQMTLPNSAYLNGMITELFKRQR